ncbi:hypothetical protein [Conchiformibius steedae]|uniref:hypothetical protein n=1 Tax=Conchiformibius steedae TaxID=153493 RepID=UPI0026F22506|nr:hypothetical protein [Conchiformibius steedae]
MNESNQLSVLQMLLNFKPLNKFDFNDDALKINLDLSGLSVCLSNDAAHVKPIDIIDKTVGYLDVYATTPIMRFSTQTKQLQYFLYTENIENVYFLQADFLLNKKIIGNLYFDGYLEEGSSIANWELAYILKNKIFFISNKIHPVGLEMGKVVISPSLSFLLYQDAMIGLEIDFKTYFSNKWDAYEEIFLSDYLTAVCKANWLAKEDNENIETLKRILTAYKGNVFVSDVNTILMEIKSDDS